LVWTRWLREPATLKGKTLSTESPLTLALIHTSPTLTPVFTALCSREMPDAHVFHVVDESLIQETIRAGSLRKLTIRRLVSQIASAEAAGANAVLVTCSSIGPGVQLAQQLFDMPVLRIDEAMAEIAVRQAHTIGVLATLRTTLDPTTALLREKAAEAGRAVELVECLCEGAFPAVLAGDTATHDRMLRQALVEDLKGVDVIVLAQASMARVVATLAPGTLHAQVLSSPELAVQRARQALALHEVARARA
jgi:Asp/Glu/hydantoin racemase